MEPVEERREEAERAGARVERRAVRELIRQALRSIISRRARVADGGIVGRQVRLVVGRLVLADEDRGRRCEEQERAQRNPEGELHGGGAGSDRPGRRVRKDPAYDLSFFSSAAFFSVGSFVLFTHAVERQ